MITWTWVYFPFWLTAGQIPQSSAVVSTDGRVYFASGATRHPDNKVFLLTGHAGNRIVRNVTGTASVLLVDVKYRFAEHYLAGRGDEEDASKPLISAANAVLSVESKKSRSSRIALFQKGTAHDRLLERICGAVAKDGSACPLKLTLTPQNAATTLGGIWSKTTPSKKRSRKSMCRPWCNC